MRNMETGTKERLLQLEVRNSAHMILAHRRVSQTCLGTHLRLLTFQSQAHYCAGGWRTVLNRGSSAMPSLWPKCPGPFSGRINGICCTGSQSQIKMTILHHEALFPIWGEGKMENLSISVLNCEVVAMSRYVCSEFLELRPPCFSSPALT